MRPHRVQGQIIVLATILVLFFVLLAAVLIDVYHIEEARDWGYSIAQEAALAGVTSGEDWASFEATPDPDVPTATPRPDHCVEPGLMYLNENVALNRATDFVNKAMSFRNVTPSTLLIHVFPNPGGDSGSADFPPHQVRLGGMLGQWSSHNPAVGVYIEFPVSTFFMSIVGKSSVLISVFGSAQVAQPVPCPTMTPG